MAYQEQQAKLQMERQLQLHEQEETAKKNVTKALKQKRQKLKQKQVCYTNLFISLIAPTHIQAEFLHSYTTKNRDIYQSFHRAEEQMKQVLKARKAEIRVSYQKSH